MIAGMKVGPIFSKLSEMEQPRILNSILITSSDAVQRWAYQRIKLFLRAFPLIALCFSLSSCIGIVGMLDTGSQLDRSQEGVFLDIPGNRDYRIRIYEKAVQSEASGGYLAPAYDTWDERWAAIFKVLRNGDTENPELYIDYIKRRRAELGLPND
jgi:hypothetical protein